MSPLDGFTPAQLEHAMADAMTHGDTAAVIGLMHALALRGEAA